jgi:hypothetical protein
MGLNQDNSILSNAIKVSSTYNVGIGGAADASAKLKVTGTTNLTGALSGTSATFSGTSNSGVKIKQGAQIGNPVTSGDFYNGLTLENSSSTNAFALGYTSGGSFSISSFDGTSTYTKLLTISNGNLGIGTSSPNYLLGVNSSGINSYMQFTSSTTGTSSSDGFIIGSGDAGDAVLLNRENTSTIFFTNNSERMRVASNSPSLLINGTNNLWGASDRGVLHINGSSAIYGITIAGSNAGYIYHSGTDMFINQVKSGGAMSIINEANNYLIFGTNNTERMRIDAAGVVNFNGNSTETSFNDKFSLGYSNGSYGWMQTWSGRPLYFNRMGNAVYAGTQRIDNNSDQRIKENIVPIQNALDVILALNGRKFNMLDEEGKLRYGFIAQEVQPHLADFVTESDRTFEKDDLKIENLLTLENSGAAWGALLVEAIKELKAEIDILKQQ